MFHQRLGMTREMETWLSDSGVNNNSVISVVLVMRLHCCCHLLNKVENITWTPYIPSALNRLRGAVKLLFPRGRSGPSLIHGFFPHQSPVFSGSSARFGCSIVHYCTCRTTISWPLYRSTCVSRHLQLRTGTKFYCPHAFADGN